MVNGVIGRNVSILGENSSSNIGYVQREKRYNIVARWLYSNTIQSNSH